ncbi:tripartite tricarboxylate transporter substrate binding protein [Polynucleobacter sp. AP-Latsch-80-C2]|jgi:tripartite-type tricarboxylate transporter receptor subunit TctC|uniref:tripartite tricarboxylate transporter substrate binding protein n=1 Tax=Polynucleobacter sp. AP-Latsch-80-C2 TaxID=2576931 RepID=UPI001C0CCB93|nr:tripartite tricarboxylate transporter substrate binding protein [Polynucleobacter sp. AP-Latsch-80-C2]MBU3623830.1 tripartite tricarboxylate transporter substrate binding protein [Polynucleobacter sp. AP-Latsch-80-C2]
MRLFFISLLAVILQLTTPVHAAEYPNRTIKMIIPFAPGGGSDTLGRVLAEKMGNELGASVIVENKPGASSIIGTDAVAKDAPDGYTLLLTNSAITSNPTFFKLPFDTQSLSAITKVANAPQLLVANPGAPFKNLKELLAYAKANPGKVTIGTAGAGQISHLAAELLEKLSGTEMTMVHYKGSGGALADLLGGQINMSFGTAPGLMQFIRSGKVIPIAVSSGQRMSALPNVPSIAEVLPGYDINNWFGIFAPPQTPKPIVDRIYQAVNKALASPELSKKFGEEGFDIVAIPPDKFEKSFKQEIGYWQKFAKDNNLKID